MNMTPLQQKQFNQMLAILTRIAKSYQTPKQLRRSAEKEFGLDYQEALEMSYENMQEDAKHAIKGVKRLTPPTP